MTIRGLGVSSAQKDMVRKATRNVRGDQDPTDNDYRHGALGSFTDDEKNRVNFFYGIKGMSARTNPELYLRPGMKAACGLHDVSATLLTGSRHKTIASQRKWYTDAIWMFMPLPKVADIVLFHELKRFAAISTVSVVNCESSRTSEYHGKLATQDAAHTVFLVLREKLCVSTLGRIVCEVQAKQW